MNLSTNRFSTIAGTFPFTVGVVQQTILAQVSQNNDFMAS